MEMEKRAPQVIFNNTHMKPFKGSMSIKRKLVRLVFNWTDEWNKEVHQAFEERVIREYHNSFPNCNDDEEKRAKRIANMRAYYTAGMTTTASLLLAAVALFVAFVALIVAVAQLFTA